MSDILSFVDPFIGVDGPGGSICGSYLPYSIVRLSPDTGYMQNTTGYKSGRPIVCFSHTHVAGTGGASRYGNIGLLPFSGRIRYPVGSCMPEKETAKPGYYSAELLPDNIRVELTSTPRTGFHRYTYLQGVDAGVLVDVGSVIQSKFDADKYPPTPGETTGRSIGGFVEVVSDTEMIGRGDYKGGWGHEYPYSVYFYLKADEPFVKTLAANYTGAFSKDRADGPNCRVLIDFGAQRQICLRVGISFVSVANARASVERESGARTFDEVRKEAEATWERYLSRIRVEGGVPEQQKLFYTLFSKLLCMPGDLGTDDENPYWKSGVRQFTDFYCLWDSVRVANSFLLFFDPELEADFLNCLLDIAEHRGWFPDAWITGHSAFIQGGSSADILFSEAAQKGLAGVDYEKALKYMRKNSETDSPDPDFYGRHMEDYRERGYVTTKVRLSCVSRHMEYAYQDWCIGALADKLGKSDIARRYYESSAKLWNLWRDDIKAFAPKSPGGDWIHPYDYKKLGGEYSWVDPYFYEGTSYQWSFNTQHDFYGLIDRCGGPSAFVERLDDFFDNGHYHSKETMLHIPYLYIYAGRHDKTVERVRECMEKYFRVSRDGLADNEDMGCQSSFYMCSALGIYPVMGQDLYLLSSPVFSHTEIDIGKTGKTLIIDAPGAEKGYRYVRSIKINGVNINRAWVVHSELSSGGKIEFELTEEPVRFGLSELPPQCRR